MTPTRIPQMDPKSYVTNVLKTESNNFDIIGERLSQTRNIRLLHATIGIMTEVGELFEMLEKPQLDLTNLREEVSDALWYSAIAVDELGLDLGELMKTGDVALKAAASEIHEAQGDETQRRALVGELLAELTMSTSILLDLMKKSAFYGKELDTAKFTEVLGRVVGLAMVLLAVGGFEIGESFTVNIEKLRKRYGDKFSEHAAINRDLASERKILEGHIVPGSRT